MAARIFPPDDPRHGTNNLYNQGCRCDACRAARREKQRAWKASVAGREPTEHGVSGYSNWGCRCEVCSAAWAVEMKDRLDREAPPREGTPHGRWMYERHGCRCEVCVKANWQPKAAHARKVQAESLDAATNHYKEWTGPEMEILTRSDLTRREKAAMLGRTYDAVTNMLAKLDVDPRKQRLAGQPKPEAAES